MNDCTFRLVRSEDVPEILSIYATYVRDTAVTFEYEPPSLAEFQRRVADIFAEYPYVVCRSGQRVIGYAYAHRHMERAAYQWNAELSVYLDRNFHSCGIGRRLYEILIEILRLQNVKNVYGGVTSPNEKSERLHEALGFARLGTYHNAGYKCGGWHDVSWFEKSIGEHGDEPAPFAPIQTLDDALIEKILSGRA